MKKIIAVVPTRDEETNIGRCLESLSWCDEIVVIVTGHDNTAKIARDHKATVIEKHSQDKDDYEALQKNINWVIDNVKTDWILRVDADEVVTKDLEGEIKEIIKKSEGNIVAYGIPRKQYLLGHFLKGGDWAYDRLVRLFKPQFCRYEPIVKIHEQFKVMGKVGYLSQSLLHYSHPDMKTLMRKFDVYTTLEAKQLKDSKPVAFFKLLFLPPYIFLRWMIYHHGYRDGFMGIIAGAMRAYYDILLYSKYLFG